jgi:3-methyladenine DNA glycosylase AlkD
VAADLVVHLRDALAAAADPGRAPDMQRYMKSAMPYHGVTAPVLRRTVQPLIAAHPLPDRAAWEATIRELWDAASYREERYAAIAVAGHRRYRGHQDPDAVAGLYRHLITTGAWWDLVDSVAPGLVGPILAAHPRSEGVRMREWAIADDLWLRRASIICQLGAKGATDLALLTDVIEANVEGTRFGREFFVRKAIGWALRQHARTDAAWVAAFVAEHDAVLSGLSKREALKHIA